MSGSDASSASTTGADKPVTGTWGAIETFVERCGERFNPILVKEARQALKSRQFLITFALVLICGWLWSILGVAIMTPEIFHAPRGREMLTGYYWILAFPLFVIVPFGAFRSLASEIEDGTFELITVSTLTPLQIVRGKLGSSLLQGMIYFSALAPCIAFTFLLRGIDIISILLLLGFTGFGTIVFANLGLFLATVSRSKGWQLVVSVGLVILLFLIFVRVGTWMAELLDDNVTPPYGDPSFWATALALGTSIGSYAVLFYYAAAARITFPSENRSTKLRVIMLGQQVLLVIWTVYLFAIVQDPSAMLLCGMFGGIHWTLMGALMIGESSHMTQRIQRSLPQTTLGRTLLAWFAPGPDTGYFFAVLNMLSLAIFSVIAVRVGIRMGVGQSFMATPEIQWFGFMICGYLAAYLGLARLILFGLSRVTLVGPFLGLLITILLVLAGTLAPVAIDLSLDQRGRDGYSLIQVTNPFWTLVQFFDPSPRGASMRELGIARTLVLVTGSALFIINLALALRAIRADRLAAPQRVQLDDAHRQRSAAARRARETGVHPLDE